MDPGAPLPEIVRVTLVGDFVEYVDVDSIVHRDRNGADVASFRVLVPELNVASGSPDDSIVVFAQCFHDVSAREVGRRHASSPHELREVLRLVEYLIGIDSEVAQDSALLCIGFDCLAHLSFVKCNRFVKVLQCCCTRFALAGDS